MLLPISPIFIILDKKIIGQAMRMNFKQVQEAGPLDVQFEDVKGFNNTNIMQDISRQQSLELSIMVQNKHAYGAPLPSPPLFFSVLNRLLYMVNLTMHRKFLLLSRVG